MINNFTYDNCFYSINYMFYSRDPVFVVLLFYNNYHILKYQIMLTKNKYLNSADF